MTLSRHRLQRVLGIAAVMYGLLLFLLSTSLPQNVDHVLPQQRITSLINHTGRLTATPPLATVASKHFPKIISHNNYTGDLPVVHALTRTVFRNGGLRVIPTLNNTVSYHSFNVTSSNNQIGGLHAIPALKKTASNSSNITLGLKKTASNASIITWGLKKTACNSSITTLGLKKTASNSSNITVSSPCFERPALSTVCPMRLTMKDKIPVEEYFQPRPQQVTQVVSTFLIQPHPQFCRQSLDILILVPSSPPRASYRNAIRETWGSGFWPDVGLGINMEVLFVLGRSPNDTAGVNISRSVRKEAASHRDMLVIDAEDGYRQMSVKMLAGMLWLSQRCRHTSYIARVDEDHFLNVPLLYLNAHTWFQQHSELKHHAVIGKILCSHSSVVHRTNKSKHFVEFSDYPYDYFPTYLAGGTFIMSAELMHRMVSLSRYVRTFTVDDAYVTGVLVRVMKLLLVNLPGIAMNESVKRFMAKCGISKHKSDPKIMRIIWQMLSQNTTCHGRILAHVTCKDMCSSKRFKWA